METEDILADTCPCSISLTTYGTFTVYGGKRGGFSKNVLENMPPGPWYEMAFDKEENILTVRRAPPPWIKNKSP